MENTQKIECMNCIFRDISPSVYACTRVKDVGEKLINRVTDLLGAKGAIVRTLNPETNHLDLVLCYGLSEQYISKGPVFLEKAIHDLHQQSEISIITNILGDPRIQYPDMAWKEGVRMAVDAPLFFRGTTVGLMRIYFDKQRELSTEELKFLQLKSREAACAIEKAGILEKQRRHYESLSRQTEKLSALGRLSAGIAHEINNPLAGILLYSSNLIKKVPEGSPLREGLQVIINETKRCKTIIQDLLEFSRTSEPQKELANINEVIENALSILGNEFRLQHIRLEKQLSGDMVELFIDKKQIQQVFINILLNAIQATENEGTVTIRSSIISHRKQVSVEVSDSGCGIQEDDLPRVFDPFFSTKTDGTGLGLAVSYSIIQNHSANIQVSSEPGKGTCVTIDFPVHSGPR